MPKAADQMAGKVPTAAPAATAPKQPAPQKAAPPKQTAAPKPAAPAPAAPAKPAQATGEFPLMSVAPFDPYSQEGPSAAADRQLPYIEAVRGIKELRDAQKIGPSVGASRGDVFPTTRTVYRSMMVGPESASYDAGMSREEAALRRQGRVAPPVMPPAKTEDMAAGKLADIARSVDLAYQAAKREAADVADRAARAAVDPYTSGRDLTRMEDERVRALRRVADLAAARREFGIKTSQTGNASEDQQLAPAETVGPRTGGGKEYY